MIGFWRRAAPPAVLGLVGVASLPLVIVPALEGLMAAGRSPTRSLALLTLLSLIQPAVLVVATAVAGAALAPRLGFTSYLAGVNVQRPFGTQVRRAIGAGLLVGAAIVVLDIALFAHFVLRTGSASLRLVLQGLAGGILYGGLSEEVMMRWGAMTFVVWVGARLDGRRGRPPAALRADQAKPLPPVVYVLAIVVVALLFAAGHLPAASALAPLTTALVLRIVLLNGVAGLVFGWLYWKASLEAAMLAHASVHVVFALAQVLGWS